MTKFDAVLFDLDGTLFDTLPDFMIALNALRHEHQLEPIHEDLIRPLVNLGSKAMLNRTLDIDDTHPNYQQHRDRIIDLYSQNIASMTRLFNNMDKVLAHLEEKKIPWGIVTNKPQILTELLLKTINLLPCPHIVVSGDTLDRAKPYPDPILHACKSINVHPANCLFIGDAKTDVDASKAAGSTALVALYGYIDKDDHPESWEAHGYINEPLDILKWL